MTEPVMAAFLWVQAKFGEEKAKLVARCAEELGSEATVDAVKTLYNARLGFKPAKKMENGVVVMRAKVVKKISLPTDSGIDITKSEESFKTSTPKPAEEKEDLMKILLRMEKEMNRLV